LGAQLPGAPFEAAPELLLVELASLTSLTPSIRRRRWSTSATSPWLVAQPLRVNVGTVPAGVAEATVAEPAPDDALVDF
jgi:hypothetical protein